MQFATLALLASTVAALPASLVTRASSENVTITNASYSGVNGYAIMQFTVEEYSVTCSAEKYDVPSDGHACSDSSFTFDIQNAKGTQFTLHHTVDGTTYSGDVQTSLNGAIPTFQEQVGTASVTLTAV